jgi:hypothetical protein
MIILEDAAKASGREMGISISTIVGGEVEGGFDRWPLSTQIASQN